MCLVLGTSTAALAAEPSASPAQSTEVERYWGETVMSDVIVLTLVFPAFMISSTKTTAAVMGAAFIGIPALIHLSHDNTTGAVLSAGVRAGSIGLALLAAEATDDCGDALACGFRTFGAVALGSVAASLVDAIFIARHHKPTTQPRPALVVGPGYASVNVLGSF
jgi:hypothetical protein